MNVIYRPYLVKEIHNVIARAMEQNREIEKILITPEEEKQLVREMATNLYGTTYYVVSSMMYTVCGVRVEVGK